MTKEELIDKIDNVIVEAFEGNEHLLGKTDNCDDFYKTWE